jgi:hypothetical protein
MGTTIRREPVSFAIPKAPDYKFLNITNFGGIEKSSNPFVVSSNTASDCLNVYVDENNALTTRPRVCPKYELVKLAGLPSNFTVIAVYNLHDGYLLQGYRENEYTSWIKFTHNNSGELSVGKEVIQSSPKKPVCVFEQNEKIYILGSGDYLTFDGETLAPVEPYIPTTRVGKNKRTKTLTEDGGVTYIVDTEGSSYEALNLITNKFKETYFWDGMTNPASFKESDSDVIENNYITHIETMLRGNHDYLSSLELLSFAKQASKASDKYNYYLGYHWYDNNLKVIVTTKANEHISSSDVYVATLPTSYSDYIVAFSSSGKTVAFADLYGDNTITTYTRKNLTDSFVKSTITVGDIEDPIKKILLNEEGDRLCCVSSDNKLYMYVKGTSWSRVYTPNMRDIESVEDVTISADGTIIVYLGKLNGVYTIIKSEIPLISVDLTDVELPKFWTHNEYPSSGTLQLSRDGQRLVIAIRITANDGKYTWLRDELRYVSDVAKSSSAILLDSQKKWMSYGPDNVFRFSNENRKVYFKTHKDQGFFTTDNPTAVIFDMPYSVLSMPEVDTADNSISGLVGYCIKTEELALDSSEPLMSVIKTKDTEDSADLRISLLTARTFTRFDNNTWFASGNYTFHTEYNDPTYIPISSYNTLGENYEDITGLSIVNDNILAAYKRNKIYIITPVTVGDQLTYSYTETKNVIGNDVVGAPILTILTEMPTIVSYDGIYALNQLENVQSGDRITTLISEAINPKWLKESKADIDRCLTMNRLYWTYYILPHKRQSGEKDDCTKVYLLDNRTQQWYYWELPLFCVNAFIKENQTHLVDDLGQIFTLETSDLTGSNPNETEYYDKLSGGEKILIPWCWTSQILSLNTINYSKRLVDTTFILTDTDTQDGYSLDYTFKAWRKTVSETNQATLGGDVHYVQSMTKRTRIPRFSFIQFKLENTKNDVQNNKLRLVGLGLKYVLLEGLY